MDTGDTSDHSDQPTARLRLYVARSTPNSVRAEQNLAAVLAVLSEGFAGLMVETIDVFLQPKRAITDGVVVTPTLIGSTAEKRIVLMGDLADRDHLLRNIQDLLQANDAR
jgi:circadian clock protein KaiB